MGLRLFWDGEQEVSSALQCEQRRAAEDRGRWGRLQEEKAELEEVLTQTRRKLKVK